MSRLSFDTFFQTATGNHTPYDYQCRLACGADADPDKPETLRGNATCQSQLINIPTGLGKTAAVALAWLWNQLQISLNSQPSTVDHPWSRCLVYRLPMRTVFNEKT